MKKSLRDDMLVRWATSAVCSAALLVGGCDEEDLFQDGGWFPGPVVTQDAAPIAQDSALPASDSAVPGSDAAIIITDSGPSIDAAVDAATGSDAAASDAAPGVDGSTAIDGATSDATTAVDARADANGGSDAGALALPAPDQAGPYQVVEQDNVGMGFENPIASDDQGTGGWFCEVFIGLFDPSQVETYAPVPATYNMALYTLYRPEPAAPGQKFPVLSWANGTCAHTVGYANMIKHVVSHGFIVIAPHSRFTGSGAEQIRGIDWVLGQNEVASSPLFGHVDKDKIGIFGHSQGGGSTGIASADPRVDTSILMHGGNGDRLHAPAFFLTGENDNPTGVRANYDAAGVAAAFGNLRMSNHITMMTEAPRMAPEVTAWFRYQLLGDSVARGWFVGTDCLLCKDPEWIYASKNLQ
jgi:hypothetical protein